MEELGVANVNFGAMRTFGSMGELAIRSTEAGHDLLLICSDLSAGEEAFTALREAYQSGRLHVDTLLESATKFVTTRQRFSI